MIIREIREGDRSAYLEMSETFYKSPAVLADIPASYRVNAFSEYLRGVHAKCFIFEEDGGAVGYGIICFVYSQEAGGMTAVNLQVAEKYVAAFSELAKTSNTLVVPGNMGDLAGMIASAMKIIEGAKAGGAEALPKPKA